MRRVSNGSLMLDKIRTGCNNLFCSKNGIHLTLHWRPNYRTGPQKLYLICQGFEIHVQAFTVQTVLTVKEENLYSKTKKFLPWLGATLWTKYLIDLFLKPHPWISQLSPNYNSAGSTASKAYLIRLCQLRFQCFFFLRYQIILEELLQMIFFTRHTTYSWNNMCQKCEGKSGTLSFN